MSTAQQAQLLANLAAQDADGSLAGDITQFLGAASGLQQTADQLDAVAAARRSQAQQKALADSADSRPSAGSRSAGVSGGARPNYLGSKQSCANSDEFQLASLCQAANLIYNRYLEVRAQVRNAAASQMYRQHQAAAEQALSFMGTHASSSGFSASTGQARSATDNGSSSRSTSAKSSATPTPCSSDSPCVTRE